MNLSKLIMRTVRIATDATVTTVNTTKQTVTHPIQTAKEIKETVSNVNYKETYNNTVKAITDTTHTITEKIKNNTPEIITNNIIVNKTKVGAVYAKQYVYNNLYTARFNVRLLKENYRIGYAEGRYIRELINLTNQQQLDY